MQPQLLQGDHFVDFVPGNLSSRTFAMLPPANFGIVWHTEEQPKHGPQKEVPEHGSHLPFTLLREDVSTLPASSYSLSRACGLTDVGGCFLGLLHLPTEICGGEGRLMLVQRNDTLPRRPDS